MGYKDTALSLKQSLSWASKRHIFHLLGKVSIKTIIKNLFNKSVELSYIEDDFFKKSPDLNDAIVEYMRKVESEI